MWKPVNVEPIKLIFLDKLGWPVERIKGRPVINFLRLLIHTRKVVTHTKWFKLVGDSWSSGPVIDILTKSDI